MSRSGNCNGWISLAGTIWSLDISRWGNQDSGLVEMMRILELGTCDRIPLDSAATATCLVSISRYGKVESHIFQKRTVVLLDAYFQLISE